MNTNRDRVLLVTGASGYLGRHLTRRAIDEGYRVVSGYRGNLAEVAAGTPFPLDLLESGGQLEERILNLSPNAIIHTASLTPGTDPDSMMSVNRGFTARIAKIA